MSLFKATGVFTLLFSISATANIQLNINQKINDQINITDLKTKVSNSDIVFIGGEHDEPNEAYVKKLALKINELDSRYNCITWEESEMHAENMLTAHKNWDKFVDNFYVIDYRIGKIFSSVFGFHPNPRQIIPKNIRPLVKAGIKNVPIDHTYTNIKWLKEFKMVMSYPEESPFYWKHYVRLILNDRNEYMSSKIHKLKESGVCDKIMVSIGGEHLNDNFFADKTPVPTPRLQSYLEDYSHLTVQVNSEDERLVQPQQQKLFNGLEIKNFLNPISHPSVQRWIHKIHKMDVLNNNVKPDQRRHSMYLHDIELQKGVQILIDRKDITENTMVLSDTGHDLPIAAQIASSERFRILHAFHFPKYFQNERGNFERILPQLQDWASYLHTQQKKWATKKEPNLIFIGLEGHRKDYEDVIKHPIQPEWLPNNQELKELGVKKIVYLYERHPDFKDIKPMADIKAYLNQVSVPVQKLGTDCRRKPGC